MREIKHFLEKELKKEIIVPQFAGVLGAAFLAWEGLNWVTVDGELTLVEGKAFSTIQQSAPKQGDGYIWEI